MSENINFMLRRRGNEAFGPSFADGPPASERSLGSDEAGIDLAISDLSAFRLPVLFVRENSDVLLLFLFSVGFGTCPQKYEIQQNQT